MARYSKQESAARAAQVLEMYKSGKSGHFIREALKMDDYTIQRIITDAGVKRTREEAVRAGKSKAKINDNALDILTPEALYWIGFLYADGHIEKDRPRITLTLSEVDKSHLEKFSMFFGGGITIRQVEYKTLKSNGYVTNPAYRAAFSSKKIYERLKELHFTNRKTYGMELHELLKNSVDFWRGVFDGDGWLYKTKRVGVGLSGHENTIVEFLSFVNKSGIETTTSAYNNPKRPNLWQANIHDKKAILISTLLYRDACVYLDRKYEKYLEIIKT